MYFSIHKLDATVMLKHFYESGCIEQKYLWREILLNIYAKFMLTH